MSHLNPTLQHAIERLAERVPRALLVGGAVRDELLQLSTKDADVEVYGVSADDLFTILQELFPVIDAVGRSFGIFKVTLDDGSSLDVAIPRTESKSGLGHKAFSVTGNPDLSVEEAFRRRDFTVNAIAKDVKTGEYVDPFNGRADLESRTLRVVDPQTFVDDPLRVFRAVQFVARFHLSVPPETMKLLRSMVAEGELETLSKERVTDEWRKLLLKAEKPSIGLSLMRELGIVKRYYPELHALIDTPQEPEWHPEGDVWIHTLMVLDVAAKILRAHVERFSERDALTVMLGSLVHDFGKPLVTEKRDGKWRAFGHEEAGISPAKSFFSHFTFGEVIAHDAFAIIRDHLKPSVHYRAFQKGEINDVQYANIIRRLLKRLDGLALDVFLAVTEADMRGRGLKGDDVAYPEGEFLRAMVKKESLVEASRTLLLTGRELIDEFGMTEGSDLGQMIKKIEEARDNGEISTKEEARLWVKDMLD